MKELRQAAVLILTTGLISASACGSDDNGGVTNAGGAIGTAGSGEAGRAQAGGAGAGHAAGAPAAAGSPGDAGSSDRGGAAGAAGGSDEVSASGAAGTSDESAGSGGSGGSIELEGGDSTYKLVFVTSTRYSGKFGSVSGADAQCQARAVAAELAGTYKAWISGNDLASSPSVRFTHASVPYRLVDGSVIADDWGDLTDGTLQHALDLTELNTELAFFALTYTLADGTPGLFGSSTTTCYSGNNCNCDNWTNDQAQGSPTPASAVGAEYALDDTWTDYSFVNACGGGDDGLSLYCFEQ